MDDYLDTKICVPYFGRHCDGRQGTTDEMGKAKMNQVKKSKSHIISMFYQLYVFIFPYYKLFM